MRTLSCLTLLAALAAPAVAEANCYSIYDAQNRLSYQSNIAPIDLSKRISEAMPTRFPGGFLVMIPDESACREFRTGLTARPRSGSANQIKASAAPNELVLPGSPLLRDTRSLAASDGPSQSAGSTDLATREAVRSGTALSIKRQAAPARP